MIEKWSRATLEELCIIGDGNHSSKYPKKSEMVSDGVPFIRSTNLVNGEISREDILYISEEKHRELKKGHLRINDVLFTNRGEIGKVAIVDNLFDGANLNSQIAWLRCRNDLLPRYLFFFLQSEKMLKHFSREKSGAALQQFTIKMIKEVIILYPPLSEQKRIVAIVDQAFEAIDGAIENTKQNLVNARELFESYLNDAFDRKGDGWAEKTLGDVCIFQGGSQPPKSSFSAEKKEGYIRLIQIRDYKSDKYIVYILKKDARRFCQPDDVMIGRYGPPLFQILRGIEGAYNVALMKAIPNEDLISKDFLFHFLKNKKILSYVINSSSRTAGQTGLNKATIEPYPIAFPSLEKQAMIVTQLQELKAETQRLEAIYRQKLAALTELKQSILQKAFTGELTADQKAP